MPELLPDQLVAWLYLDMNSFFASVEQEMSPSLRGKPVAVIPTHAESTCCIAVSYEAKAHGVKTGTLVREARRLCPGIRFIVGDHADYVRYHNKIIEAVDTCVPVEAVCSIDEIACRLTGSQQDPAAAYEIALKVKAAIRDKAGAWLKCSIGLAPSRYLAKIAADMRKPDGLTVVRPCDLPNALYTLKLSDLPGVGERTGRRLEQGGIATMRELLGLGPKEMRRAWGSLCGEEMWHLLRGEEPPGEPSEKKSISHSHVLPPEMRNPASALGTLKKLTDKAAVRLRDEGYYASGIHVYARFIGLPSWKEHSFFQETQDTAVFISEADRLWRDLPEGRVIAVGMALTGLVPEAYHAPTLFEDERRSRLMKVLDGVNAKYGKSTLRYATVPGAKSPMPLRIAFTRIPGKSEL